ncbi:hypothetical protein [Vibrio fluvialis]|uniref:hypothetical protein n=1 Tax=Vibrio fluvialis TaxID=676 RepID=UPI001C9DB9B4|nr:hypothetical protein [Vibrio fluvialis]
MVNKSFSSIYIWVHSTFAATSIAFFLSLLSASAEVQDSLPIELASVFFCASLIINSGLAFVLIWFGEFKEFINRLYPLYPWRRASSVPSVAIISFVLGLVCLLVFYSFWLSVVSVVVTSVVYIKVGSIYNGVIDDARACILANAKINDKETE